MGTLVRKGLNLKRLACWCQFDPPLVIFPKMCFLKRERERGRERERESETLLLFCDL